MKNTFKYLVNCLLSVFICFPLFISSVFAEDSSSYYVPRDFTFGSDAQSSAFFDIVLDFLGDNSVIYQSSDKLNIVLATDIVWTDSDYFTGNYTRIASDGTVSTGTYTEPHKIGSSAYCVSLIRDGVREIYICDYFGLTACEFTVTVSSNGNGTASGSGVFVYPDYVTISAEPYLGYQFDHWEITRANDLYTFTETSNPYTFQLSDTDYNCIAYFSYSGTVEPTPTATPTPTPTPPTAGPTYEINVDFQELLSNPAIASLVQYALNDLQSNTWWVEREIYYYDPVSCPSGSTPLYSNFGYVERFVLYNYTNSGLSVVSDSINHVGQSSLGCLIDANNSSVVIPDLENSPRITETLFYGFDLFEIPEKDFFDVLISIRDAIFQSGSSAAIESLESSVISGNSSSQNTTNELIQSNTSLDSAVTSYDEVERALTDDFKISVDSIDTDFSWGSNFLNAANFVRTSFNELVEPEPIYNLILFSLILGFSLFIIGRMR